MGNLAQQEPSPRKGQKTPGFGSKRSKKTSKTPLSTLECSSCHTYQGPLPATQWSSPKETSCVLFERRAEKLRPQSLPPLQALFLLSELRESLPNELICLSGSGDKSKEEN